MKAGLAHVDALLDPLPSELADELLEEFKELRRRFLLRDWGPSELNGGRFAEVVLRVLEWMMDEKYTPLGKQLNREKITNRVKDNTSLPEGFRFQVRVCTDLLMDVRNKRDVGHLSSPGIDVNRMDSELVLRLCSWVLAEMVREFGGLDPDTAQNLIDKISVEQVPWIEEVDDDLLVLATELPADSRTLLALHHAHPFSVPISDLRAQVRYSNSTDYRKKVLAKLLKPRWIHVKDGAATITSKGISEIEKKMVDLRG
jgi:hypothetical protein